MYYEPAAFLRVFSVQLQNLLAVWVDGRRSSGRSSGRLGPVELPTKKPTLQLWLSGYIRKTRAKPPQCRLCDTPYFHSALSVIPLPWIWIDIPPRCDQLFTISTALTLGQEWPSRTQRGLEWEYDYRSRWGVFVFLPLA
jgi:hypothetical protein